MTRRLPNEVRGAQCRVRWWHAGGLHVHVNHPDGSTSHYIFKKHEWWQVDAIAGDMQARHGRSNVEVIP